jgi:hypothetical protein
MLFKGTLFSTGGYSAQYGQALSSVLILRTQDLPAENATAINLMAVGLGAAHTERWENSSLAYEGMYYNLGPYANVFPQRIKWDEFPNGSQSMMN